ncbi:MAG: hypothetical protein IIW74_00335, partial [Rikenellaceae bacterium]|nr:hypothetical protein [Rikenellaceae bacterium]
MPAILLLFTVIERSTDCTFFARAGRICMKKGCSLFQTSLLHLLCDTNAINQIPNIDPAISDTGIHIQLTTAFTPSHS